MDGDYYNQMNYNNGGQMYNMQPPKKKKGWLVAIIIVVALLLVCCCCPIGCVGSAVGSLSSAFSEFGDAVSVTETFDESEVPYGWETNNEFTDTMKLILDVMFSADTSVWQNGEDFVVIMAYDKSSADISLDYDSISSEFDIDYYDNGYWGSTTDYDGEETTYTFVSYNDDYVCVVYAIEEDNIDSSDLTAFIEAFEGDFMED